MAEKFISYMKLVMERAMALRKIYLHGKERCESCDLLDKQTPSSIRGASPINVEDNNDLIRNQIINRLPSSSIEIITEWHGSEFNSIWWGGRSSRTMYWNWRTSSADMSLNPTTSHATKMCLSEDFCFFFLRREWRFLLVQDPRSRRKLLPSSPGTWIKGWLFSFDQSLNSGRQRTSFAQSWKIKSQKKVAPSTSKTSII